MFWVSYLFIPWTNRVIEAPKAFLAWHVENQCLLDFVRCTVKLPNASRKFTSAEFGTLEIAKMAALAFHEEAHSIETQFDCAKANVSLPKHFFCDYGKGFPFVQNKFFYF